MSCTKPMAEKCEHNGGGGGGHGGGLTQHFSSFITHANTSPLHQFPIP